MNRRTFLGSAAVAGIAGEIGTRSADAFVPARNWGRYDFGSEPAITGMPGELSERGACRLVNPPRGTQRYQPTQPADEDQLTQASPMITALLNHAGWPIQSCARSSPRTFYKRTTP